MSNVMEQDAGKGWAMYNGDCVEIMRGLPDDSVHYSMFSPPFASLYTFSGSPRDMSNVESHAEFFDQFSYAVRELYRITKPGRLLSFHCILLPATLSYSGFIGLVDFRGMLIRAFVENGWIHHSEVVIRKDPVSAMQRTKAIGLLHKQIKKDSCMSRMAIPDYVITMRKPGANDEPVTHSGQETGDDADMPVSLWQRYAEPVWMDIHQGETLQHRSAREEADEKHISPLQLEVIRRCVTLWSNPGDVVFSPFAGIGSEGYVSIEMGRKFIGAELKRSYYEQACRNLANASPYTSPQTSLFDSEEVSP